MLRYIQEGLKPSILAELEYQDLELKNFDLIIKKIVDAETKLVLRPRSSTKEMDQHFPRGNRLVNSTKSQVALWRNLGRKNLRSEE